MNPKSAPAPVSRSAGDQVRRARAARALSSEVKSGAFGATMIHLLVIVWAWGNTALLVQLLCAMIAVTAFNVWLSRVAPRYMTLERLEAVRIVMNTAYSCYLGVATTWHLPVWFLLPFMAVVAPDLDRYRGARVAFHTLVVSIVALATGVAPLYAAGFTALALICYAITNAKTRTIREMLEESDAQRREVEQAHSELALANERIKQDMAVLRRTEMELRQAQKLEAVGRLASGIAHEINTPVQFVGDSVHFLRSGVDDLIQALARYREILAAAPRDAVSPDVTEAVLRAEADADVAFLSENLPLAAVRAQEGLERVGVIVRSMKEFAHPDQSNKTLTDINRSVRATLTIACNEYKYVADVETELGDLPPVPCFAGELNQVLLNLIVNAAHAIADASVQGQKGTIVVRTFLEGASVVLQVSDTGTGIPEGVREHVFEPFFTTKEVGKGTGQGLALARTVIDRHDGSISFETELGRGTTFTIRIPLSEDAASPSAKAAA